MDKYKVYVVGQGESVTEICETYEELREAYHKACNLVDDEVYDKAQAIVDGEVYDEYSDSCDDDYDDSCDDDYDDGYDECGFDPYEGCYTYDC